eukprot:1702924-Ditylum_brightwellii.AAC.1
MINPKSTTDTDVRRPTLFSQQPNVCTNSGSVYQLRHTGTDNEEDMLSSRVEIERLHDLSNAQKAISSLPTKLHASYMHLNMASKAIKMSMEIMENELSLALADYDWPSVKTRVREASNKAPDNLLHQNYLKKEVGNAYAPK